MKTLRPVILLLAAAAVLLLSNFLPLPDGLTRQGMVSISIIIIGIILWSGNIMPMGITAIMLSAIMPWLGLIEFSDYYPNFASSILFFMLATFAFTAALSKSTVTPRIVNFVLKLSKGRTGIFMLGVFLGCGALSAVMSNVPTCLLFMELVIPIMEAEHMQKGVSRFGKCMMLGIPASSALGGFMAPSGSPINLLAIQFVEQMTGNTIRFLDWMLFGIPIGVISIVMMFFCYRIYFKPEMISRSGIEAVRKKVEEYGPMNAYDKKSVAIVLLVLALWIASTWIPILNNTIVALVGLCVFFLPGIRVLTFDVYIKNVNFDVLFMIGGVNVIAFGMVNSGAAQWVVNTVMGDAAAWPPILVILAVSVVGLILHNTIPAGPAVAALALPPIITIALAANINVTVCVAIISAWSSVTFLLPFDALPLITYGAGYYSMGDMVRSGIIPTILLTFILLALWPLISFIGL